MSFQVWGAGVVCDVLSVALALRWPSIACLASKNVVAMIV